MQPYFKKAFLGILLVSLSVFSSAQNAAPAPAGTANNGAVFNPMLIALCSLIVILLLAIGALAGVLRQLALVYRDRMRKERTPGQAAKAVLFLLMLILPSIHTIAAETNAGAAPASDPYISGIPRIEFYALLGVVALELVVLIATVICTRVLIRVLLRKPEMAGEVKQIVKKVSFWDRFNAVVPLEKEKDIMLDHDYDGIRELDNSLPPWWKYGFYLTILIAFVYIWYYHGGGNGPGSYDEYVAAVQKGEEEKAAYLEKTAGNIDERNVKMLDAAGMAEGKTIFMKTCAACHAADGGGLVGPNLTDEYWLHGGSLQDVFKSIKYGWQDKGMKSWKDDFSPKQIASLASFIKTLKGTRPASPKEKQGELYIEGGPAGDSLKSAVAPAGAGSTIATN